MVIVVFASQAFQAHTTLAISGKAREFSGQHLVGHGFGLDAYGAILGSKLEGSDDIWVQHFQAQDGFQLLISRLFFCFRSHVLDYLNGDQPFSTRHSKDRGFFTRICISLNTQEDPNDQTPPTVLMTEEQPLCCGFGKNN